MIRVSKVLGEFVRDDEAATMPEYALMVAFIALVCVAAITLIGPAAAAKFQALQASIAGA